MWPGRVLGYGMQGAEAVCRGQDGIGTAFDGERCSCGGSKSMNFDVCWERGSDATQAGCGHGWCGVRVDEEDGDGPGGGAGHGWEGGSHPEEFDLVDSCCRYDYNQSTCMMVVFLLTLLVSVTAGAFWKIM